MKLALVFAATILFLSAAAVLGQEVKVDVDKTVNFSNFKTFSWSKGPMGRNPLINEMIMAAVESELTARGLTKSVENADIRVSIMAATGIDLQGVGPTWNNVNYQIWGGYSNPAAMMTVTNGTLLIDLIETKSDASVWRGVARETLNQAPSNDAAADAKSVQKLVKKAVSKMFKKYPTAKSK